MKIKQLNNFRLIYFYQLKVTVLNFQMCNFVIISVSHAYNCRKIIVFFEEVLKTDFFRRFTIQLLNYNFNTRY